MILTLWPLFNCEIEIFAELPLVDLVKLNSAIWVGVITTVPFGTEISGVFPLVLAVGVGEEFVGVGLGVGLEL